MKFAFIEQHACTWPVNVMCRMLGVSRSGYYDWRGRAHSTSASADTPRVTRRAMIGGAGVVAAGITVPLSRASVAPATPDATRSSFRVAYEQIGIAEAREKAFVPHLDAVSDRAQAARDAVPHTSFYGGPNVARSPILYDTADRVSVAVSKTVVDRASDKREPYVADARRIVAAHKRRQRALAAIDERSGYNAACKHDEDLLVLITEAEAAFYATPAANPAELSFKIGVLIERDAWGDDAVPALIASDVRRIAGEGR